MASATKKTDHIRKRKNGNKGKVKKRKRRSEGTTRTMAELFGDTPTEK